MSVKVQYLPEPDADRVIWFNNFVAKLVTYAASMNISPAEVAGIQQDAAYYQYIIIMTEAHRTALRQLTSYKNLLRKADGQQIISGPPAIPTFSSPPPPVREGIFDRVALLVKRIKASLNYTESIGQDLGIIAPLRAVNIDNLQPRLSLQLRAGVPFVKSSKGTAEAIDLFADRADGRGFVFVIRLTRPAYQDNAELPAAGTFCEWKYKAIFVINNEQVGLMSREVSVVVGRV